MGVKFSFALFCALFLGQALAGEVDVPNEFVSGTPARAADVNENFDALADGINDNAQRLSALEEGSSISPALTPLAVVQQDAEIGDVVMLNDGMVTIAGYEFIRFSDDAMYSVEFPSGSEISTVVFYCGTASCIGPRDSEITYSFQLNGFDSTLQQSYRQATRITNGGSFFFDQETVINTIYTQVGPETVFAIQYVYGLNNPPPGDFPLNRAEREAVLQLAIDRLPYIEVRPTNP